MIDRFSRRSVLVQVASLAAAAMFPQTRGRSGSAPAMQVFKDPLCGCCSVWVDHMRASGFAATVTDTDMGPIRIKHGILPVIASCHTALVGGYIIEGHVPAADVKRLLSTRPRAVKGLTIPGMPASAPGMDLEPFQPYTVLSFDERGNTSTFAVHAKK